MFDLIFKKKENIINVIWTMEFWAGLFKTIALCMSIAGLACGAIYAIDYLHLVHPEKGLAYLWNIIIIGMLGVMYISIFCIFPRMLCVYDNDTRRYVLYKLACRIALLYFIWTICSHEIIWPLAENTDLLRILRDYIVEFWNKLDPESKTKVIDKLLEFVFSNQWFVILAAFTHFLLDYKLHYHNLLWFKFMRKGEHILIGKDATNLREAYVFDVGFNWIELHYKDKDGRKSTTRMSYKDLCKSYIEHLQEDDDKEDKADCVKQSVKENIKNKKISADKKWREACIKHVEAKKEMRSVKQNNKITDDKISAILAKVKLINIR